VIGGNVIFTTGNSVTKMNQAEVQQVEKMTWCLVKNFSKEHQVGIIGNWESKDPFITEVAGFDTQTHENLSINSIISFTNRLRKSKIF
jgi:hypothetical protein